ncbi:hypothetical protein DICPUDRAFT_82343 [Dictyostelium purpureum]|uniref:MINDY deubiquitinase domain-containing protein n=1 Tax=Dictyostelium purpureum TaxID=5786 RepID=F0ZW90_DICPU|nr:uncharacterized protein DICPUDRAFT_82343 [Dictyostelium purpureum]EGC31787.1 hypothetical protein DICPUDRAFT_82343 [Dictyostelium purpureum]|eukprot:XP_003291682.1 hypothetical protein DICPUDRAFT_82343 [Dictyostelium purpureum]
MADIFQYKTKDGTLIDFDVSRQSCEKYGFFAGSRVMTPKGVGTVIGVYQNNLWFHIEGDEGASFWDNGKDYESLVLKLNVQLIDDEPPIGPLENRYRVKRISYLKKEVSIILQNENGPCPLISIANVLLLQRKIHIDSDLQYVTLKKLGDLIMKYAKNLYEGNQDVLDILDDYDKNVLPTLEKGLIVNIYFDNISGFEKTEPCQIFDYLNIKLVHGWIPDPEQLDIKQIIGSLSYNDLAPKIVSFEQSFPNAKVDTQQKVNDFANSNQLTEHGLHLIQENLKEDELCVFFRNNHFATMTKHDGYLHILVSDVGYERESNIIWDRIMSKEGESIFLSGDFLSRKDELIIEVVNTLKLFGFKDSEVDEAKHYVQTIDKVDCDLIEEATKFLQSKGYSP